MKLELKNSLSVKLLRIVLLSALIVGVVLSCAQIVFDAYKTRQSINNDAERILDMFRDPSTQAVYSLDREMAMQVIEGWFRTTRYGRPPSATPKKPRWPRKPGPCEKQPVVG